MKYPLFEIFSIHPPSSKPITSTTTQTPPAAIVQERQGCKTIIHIFKQHKKQHSMKKILFVVTIMACLHANAQRIIVSPSDINMSDTDFVDVYGSIEEYNVQSNSFYDNRPLIFTCSKVSYVKKFCQHLVSLGYSSNVDYDYDGNWVSFKLYPVVTQNNQWLSVKATYNEVDGRIKKVLITGDADLVFNLFVLYWHSDISVSELKSNKVLFMDAANDRVTIDWKESMPKIVITPSPNISCLFKK